jgi:hypothetical protein
MVQMLAWMRLYSPVSGRGGDGWSMWWHRTKLKGHGNEADFLGFLQKSVPHESLTLPFAPFRIWLQIREDFCNRKTTLRLAESGSQDGE